MSGSSTSATQRLLAYTVFIYRSIITCGRWAVSVLNCSNIKCVSRTHACDDLQCGIHMYLTKHRALSAQECRGRKQHGLSLHPPQSKVQTQHINEAERNLNRYRVCIHQIQRHAFVRSNITCRVCRVGFDGQTDILAWIKSTDEHHEAHKHRYIKIHACTPGKNERLTNSQYNCHTQISKNTIIL